ncbi:MAG: outer membrane beta-barrel protein [Gammaproteobacteria bacterium]|nr:outer membrane beta-barrel protein [Gammaproteobacteria bacterium]
MKKLAYLFALAAMFSWSGAHAQSGSANAEGHGYVGGGVSLLALDNDRVLNVPTSSPGHASKLINLFLGYQFDDLWAADLRLGTEFDNFSVDVIAANGYRFFGSGDWRPFISAGLSSFSLGDGAIDDSTQQAQAGIGISRDLDRNLELRFGYQHLVTISGDSYRDNEYSAALLWHFRKPEVVPEPAPTPVAAPEPEPEPAPVLEPKPDRN